jgi:predicted phage terminase large subunit-like protein
MPRAVLEKLLAAQTEKAIRNARESFWHFCKLKAPDFYTDNKYHLRTLCNTLQALYEGKLFKEDGTPYRKIMINIPPRFGKSRTLVLFNAWVLGKDPGNMIMTGSYNDDIAVDFSRYTRDAIQEERSRPEEIIYSDIFPDTKIKQGDSSYMKWSLEGQYFSYKGVGIGGSATGKGCTIQETDDPIKNIEEAYNDNALQRQWNWWANTFATRIEVDETKELKANHLTGLQIICMTRWAKGDICGRILESDMKDDWYVMKYEAEKDGKMLCEDILSRKRYNELKSTMDPAIFAANYHQEPVSIRGILYTNFLTYSQLPEEYDRIISYADTADQGDDYLCNIIAMEKDKEFFVLDVYYTKDAMEKTEPETAKRLYEHSVNDATIESNNGGRGFARNVQRLLLENHGVRKPIIKWFHQSKNKKARILSNSSYVMQHVYFPWNWRDRWPDFYQSMTTYQKEGKNAHDDAEDAITGLVEQVTEVDKPKTKVRKRILR